MEAIITQKVRGCEFSNDQLSIMISSIIENSHEERMSVLQHQHSMSLARFLLDKLSEFWVLARWTIR
jgi:hypothetical protein